MNTRVYLREARDPLWTVGPGDVSYRDGWLEVAIRDASEDQPRATYVYPAWQVDRVETS